jgi:hypothetical protein
VPNTQNPPSSNREAERRPEEMRQSDMRANDRSSEPRPSEPRRGDPVEGRAEMRQSSGGAPTATQPDTTDDIQVNPQEIAIEAYSLFCARGYQHGDDLGDWLAAEQIVRDRRRTRGTQD